MGVFTEENFFYVGFSFDFEACWIFFKSGFKFRCSLRLRKASPCRSRKTVTYIICMLFLVDCVWLNSHDFGKVNYNVATRRILFFTAAHGRTQEFYQGSEKWNQISKKSSYHSLWMSASLHDECIVFCLKSRGGKNAQSCTLPPS